MTLSEFFPAAPTMGVSVTENGIVRHRQVWRCRRCWSLTPDRLSHYRWHQAVDTGATVQLPSDPKGTS